MIMGSIPTGDVITGLHSRGTLFILSMREMSLYSSMIGIFQPQAWLLQGVLKRGFKSTPFRASFHAAQDTVSCSHALDGTSD